MITTILIPLLLIIRQTVGMAPMTLRTTIRADENQREICVVVDGPEYQKSCYTPRGVSRVMDFHLRIPGTYYVFAVSDTFKTIEREVIVVGEQP